MEILNKLKQATFDVLFVLLDNSEEDDGTVWGLCTETGVDYLQMMSFPFDAAVLAVWDVDNSFFGLADFL